MGNLMMTALHPRLAEDTYSIVETKDYCLRLHKNALVPWLILVPKTDKIELFDCAPDFCARIRQAVDDLAVFSRDYFHADKMNIATIGNVVSQLHIHIIARKTDDFAFPDPVWGKADFASYEASRKDAIISAVKDHLDND